MTLSYPMLVAVSLAKVVVAFLLFFVYLPRKIFPQRQDAAPIERFFENLVLMVASAIVFVHLLALIRAYSIVAVAFCYALLYGALTWRRYHRESGLPQERRGRLLLNRVRRFRVRHVVLVLDVLDRVVDLKAWVRERVRRTLGGWRERAKDRAAVAHAVLFGSILLLSAALRYADVFHTPAFGFSDPYTHLLWMKQTEAGTLYPSGVLGQYYPKGFHSFMAILHGLTGVDGTLAVRLSGPLVGVLLVLSAYYCGRTLTGNREAALIGMGVLGAFIGTIHLLESYYVVGESSLKFEPTDLPTWFKRQTAALPEEFALVFLVPALFAAYSYIVGGDRRSLVRFSLASLIIFTVHSLVGIALGLGVVALAALGLLLGALSLRTLTTLGAASLVVGILGNLQMFYGLLFGVAVRQSTELYFTGWVQHIGTLDYNLEILFSAALGVLLFVGGIAFAPGRHAKLLWSFVGFYLVLLAFLARSLNFGILYLISPDRVDHYRIFLLCGALAGLYHVATLFPILANWYRKRRWFYQTVTVCSLAVLGVAGFPSVVFVPPMPLPRYEYDALAKVAHRIKRSFPPLEWTIVSTIEDYSQILRDGGWHMNGDEFLARYSPYDRALELPTRHMLLFVEKKPFPRSSYAGLNKPGVRLDIERRLQEWTNLYRMYHDDLSVYYEDWDVIVYLIARNPAPSRSSQQKARESPEVATRMFERLGNLFRDSGS